MNLGVDPFWPVYLAALFALAAAGVHILAYRRTSRPVKPWLRRLMLMIRLAAVAVVVLALWRPAAETKEILTRKARLALLVDHSRSMSIGDEGTGSPKEPYTRLARAASVFSSLLPLWKEIIASHEVSAYSFGKDIAPLPVAPDEIGTANNFGLSADAPVTALGDSLQQVARTVPPPEIILVVSDGLSNSGIDPLDAAIPGQAVIYGISVGKDQPTASTRDVAATGLFAPAEAFESSDVTVVGTFSITGLEGRPVKVKLLADGAEIGSKEISTAQREALVEAQFTFRPDKTGPVRLEVQAETLPDEIIASNNSAATYINVRKGQIKVLYVEGTFRWEAKFITLGLQSHKDIDLQFLIPKGPEDPALKSALERDWDVLIIGDLPAAALPEDIGARIADAVANGKGLLFLPGAHAYGRGGYVNSHLAACIPFSVSSDESLDTNLYRPSARPEGPYGRLVALGEEDAYNAWEKLPPLLSANLVGPPRPGASVLLEGLPVILEADTGQFSPDDSRPPAPLLAVEDYAHGRTAAMTGDGTWQWATGARLTGSEERDAAAALQRRFWRQLVFWLAKHEERGGIALRLALDKYRVEVGKSVQMEAKLLDSDMKPLTDSEVAAELVCGGKAQTCKFWLEGGVYKSEFKPPAAGDYHIRAAAVRAGREIAETSTALAAYATDVEFATLVSRPAVLAALAQSTGGISAAADNAGTVLSQMNKMAKQTQYAKLQRKELWSTWWYVAAVVALLGLEWSLRKFQGLV